MARKKEKTLIFVYGTLKRGKRLHSYFTKYLGAEFVSEGTVSGYALYYFGAPMAVCDITATLEGEIYAVPNKSLKALDYLEDGYMRNPVAVNTANGLVAAEIYEWPTTKFDPRTLDCRVPNDCY